MTQQPATYESASVRRRSGPGLWRSLWLVLLMVIAQAIGAALVGIGMAGLELWRIASADASGLPIDWMAEINQVLGFPFGAAAFSFILGGPFGQIFGSLVHIGFSAVRLRAFWAYVLAGALIGPAAMLAMGMLAGEASLDTSALRSLVKTLPYTMSAGALSAFVFWVFMRRGRR